MYDVKLKTADKTGFVIDCIEVDDWGNEKKTICEDVPFLFSDFAENTDFDLFVETFAEKLSALSSFTLDTFIEDYAFKKSLEQPYCMYYFNAKPFTFKTFAPISLSVPRYDFNDRKSFRFNLMPRMYPIYWNEVKDWTKANTDYVLIVQEVAKADEDRWLLSLSLTNASEGRYYLGGRFKLYVKKGDTIPLRFYSGKDDTVTARVEDIGYNYVTLHFSTAASPLDSFKQ